MIVIISLTSKAASTVLQNLCVINDTSTNSNYQILIEHNEKLYIVALTQKTTDNLNDTLRSKNYILSNRIRRL